MQRAEKRAENHAVHGISQFELTKIVLNNLKHFNLSPTTINVLWYLTSCYNPKYGYVFPKQATIAENLRCSERSVIRAIQSLVKEGLIIVECKTSNRYRFTSRLTCEHSQNSSNDKLSHEDEKKSLTRDNLSHVHVNEQKKEEKKEQTLKRGGNVYQGDDIILYEYAKKKANKSVTAYIKKLKESGSAKKIIEDYKRKNITFGIAYDFNASKKWIQQQAYEKALPKCTAESCGYGLNELMRKIKNGDYKKNEG